MILHCHHGVSLMSTQLSNNPTTLGEIVSATTDFESLDECAKAVDEGVEYIAKGIFYTAFAVKCALDILRTSHPAEKDYNKEKKAFFAKTNLAHDPSTQSKLEVIAKNHDILMKHKDVIPNNFTSLYTLAKIEGLETKLEMLTAKGLADNKKLRNDLTVKQLQMLIEYGDSTFKLEPKPALPTFLETVRMPKDIEEDVLINLNASQDAIKEGFKDVLTDNNVPDDVAEAIVDTIKFGSKIEKALPDDDDE